MSEWKSRKTGPNRGQHFLSSRRVSGDPQRDVLREKYLRMLMRESVTHDVNTTIQKLVKDARALDKKRLLQEKELAKKSKAYKFTQAKLEVLSEAVKRLREIHRSGRGRIGDSELKHLLRRISRDKGVPPELIMK